MRFLLCLVPLLLTVAAAGAEIPKDMQGRSIAPVLKGETPADWRTSMYYHYYEYPGAHSVRRHYGVRTGTHKLIYYYQEDERELFDLSSDKNELKNLYSAPKQAARIKELKEELSRLRKHYKVPEGDPKPPPRKRRSGK